MAHIIFSPAIQYDPACMPKPFYTMKKRSTSMSSIPSSMRNTNSVATLNAAVAAAFLAIKGVFSSQYSAYCSILGDGIIVSEVRNNSTKTSTIAAYLPSNGDIRAVRITASGTPEPFPTISSKNTKITFSDMAALYLPIVANYTSEGRYLNDDMEAACKLYGTGMQSSNEQAIYMVCELIRYGIETKTIKLGEFSAGNIPAISKRKIDMGTYRGGERICGQAYVLSDTNASSGFSNKITLIEAKAEFNAYTSTLFWTPEEEALIPEMPDDFIVPKETLKIARRFVATQKSRRPMTQFMWRGPTSIGKSTGIECLAAILHTPLLRVTCHPTMETQDFLADFVPDTASYAPANLPSFDEIEFDPVSAYEMLTGIRNEDATCQMCLEAYGKAAAGSSSTPRFKFVESNYVKALTRGYICEIQEASRIRNAGTLVGLNEYDRPGSIIPLIDGTFKKRHPNAIVVISDNKGYASCRPVDPSVLRRMALIIDSDDLPKEELFARVQYNTGCTDMAMINRMYKVYEKIIAYCQENDLMDEGSVSATEFEMWVQCVMLDGPDSMEETVLECVVNKATSDTDHQKKIRDTVVAVNLT